MQILLFKNQGFISKLIKFFTRGQYNHAAILTSNNIVYEAIVTNGVRKIKLQDKIEESIKNNTKIDYFRFKNQIPPDKERVIICFLEKQLGKKYDFNTMIGFLTYSTRQNRKDLGRWICSELVAAACEKFEPLLICEPFKISPEMISYSTKIELEKF